MYSIWLDVEGGCLRCGGGGCSFRAAEVRREGGLEEGDRGGPNVTHVSVF